MAKIVLIDDEKAVRLSVRLTLEEANHDVIEFASGLDGLDYIHQNKADLLILDIWMPEPDGISVLKRMRAQSIVLPTLVMTGSHGNMPISATEALVMTYGANDVLYKPFTDEELIDTVTKLIG